MGASPTLVLGSETADFLVVNILHSAVDILPKVNLRILSLVCKSLFKFVSPLISKQCYFRLPVTYKFKFYAPSKFVDVNNLSLISSQPSDSLTNHPITNHPLCITHLRLYFSFNPVISSLPHTLTHLTFGFWFNQKVTFLPDSLLYLKFGSLFDKPVSLPCNLQYLEFGGEFNCQMVPLAKQHHSVGHF